MQSKPTINRFYRFERFQEIRDLKKFNHWVLRNIPCLDFFTWLLNIPRSSLKCCKIKYKIGSNIEKYKKSVAFNIIVSHLFYNLTLVWVDFSSIFLQNFDKVPNSAFRIPKNLEFSPITNFQLIHLYFGMIQRYLIFDNSNHIKIHPWTHPDDGDRTL